LTNTSGGQFAAQRDQVIEQLLVVRQFHEYVFSVQLSSLLEALDVLRRQPEREES